MTASRYCLKDLADKILLERLKSLVGCNNEITADILAHFAEVDDRRLYLEQGFASLFAYATLGLGFAEGSAYKRIYAARAARRFPIIFELVQRGELHLSAVTLLAPHLCEDNHQELLAAVAHKSKRAVLELIAARFPSPDAPTLLRKLPSHTPAAPLLATAAPLLQLSASGSPTETAAEAQTRAAQPAGRPLLLPPTDAGSPSVPTQQGPASTITPLSAQRYRLQVTLSQTGRDALTRAQELLLATVPSNDLAAVCELALTALVARLEQKKFAKSTRPRGNGQRPASAKQCREPVQQQAEPKRVPQTAPARPEPEKTPGEPKQRSRYIPAAVRRAVAERDGYQCTFIGPDGRRCQERRGLDFHHDEAFCRGGPTSTDNLRLVCRAHHGHHTTRDFGAEWLKGVIAMKREPMAPAEQSPGTVALSP